jgi:hypothetical protein
MLPASVLHPFHLLCMGVIGWWSRCALSSAIAVICCQRLCNQLIFLDVLEEKDEANIPVRFKARSPVLLPSFSGLELAVARLSPQVSIPHKIGLKVESDYSKGCLAISENSGEAVGGKYVQL